MSGIVLGSFFGDEGKGQCVNNLCKGPLTLVIRFSGANQVGHNVTHDGIHHCFSNYGSGTLKESPTYWSQYCVCDPYTAVRESIDLIAKGKKPTIYYSPLCQIVLPCDVWSQWNNADNREHGTVGTGFKAVLDRVKAGYSVTMIDAKNPLILREKLRGVMKYYYKVEESNLPSFNYDKWVFNVCRYVNSVELMTMEDALWSFDDVVFEGSQGILLDQKFGIMPYCTPSNTTSENIYKHTNRHNTVTYYVCRPYITRHGNGPLCTDTKIINIEDPNNQYNDYQKSFRACEFDIKLLKHSLDIDKQFHRNKERAIVFSHLDELDDKILKQVKSLGLPVYGFEYERWQTL